MVPVSLQGLELAVVNPVGVLGPVLGADYSHSIQTIHQMLNGTLKGVPKIRFVYVDVRDVADLHLKAMILPAANGQRFPATSGKTTSVLDNFKNIFQTTPGRWLIKKRLERAHYQIVVQKQKPVDVYIDAGFENLAYFSFAFKKQFGYNVSQVNQLNINDISKR